MLELLGDLLPSAYVIPALISNAVVAWLFYRRGKQQGRKDEQKQSEAVRRIQERRITGRYPKS